MNNTFLSNKWVKEEISREIKKYSDLNEKEHITTALLVGMQTGEATVENSMEFSQKTKNGGNQDGGLGGHTAPPRTTRTDGESNGKGVRQQGNKK